MMNEVIIAVDFIIIIIIAIITKYCYYFLNYYFQINRQCEDSKDSIINQMIYSNQSKINYFKSFAIIFVADFTKDSRQDFAMDFIESCLISLINDFIKNFEIINYFYHQMNLNLNFILINFMDFKINFVSSIRLGGLIAKSFPYFPNLILL